MKQIKSSQYGPENKDRKSFLQVEELHIHQALLQAQTKLKEKLLPLITSVQSPSILPPCM
jgi:hypothetical protein